MAFNEQEKQIILDGATKGQSKTEILSRVQNFRLGIKKPAAPENSTAKDLAIGAAKGIGAGIQPLLDPRGGLVGRTAMMQDPALNAQAEKAFEFNKQATGLTDANVTPTNTTQTVGSLSTAAIPFLGKGRGLVSKAKDVVQDVTQPAANALKAGGETITSMGIRPNVQEAERILNFRANTPFIQRVSDAVAGASKSPTTKAQTATRSGIFGRKQDIGIQSKRAAQNIWTREIQPALDNTQDVITRDELFALARKKIDDTVEPSKKQAYENALALLEDEYKGINYYKLSTAQKVKSQLDDFTPSKLFKGQEVANEYASLKHEMADAIRYKIYDSLKDEGIKQKYLDYANLEDLSNMGIDALTKQKQLGGAGSFTMAMIDKALVPLTSTTGRFVYKLGDAITITSPTKVTTLRQHLQNNGVQEADFSKMLSAMQLLNVASRLNDPEDATEAPVTK